MRIGSVEVNGAAPRLIAGVAAAAYPVRLQPDVYLAETADPAVADVGILDADGNVEVVGAIGLGDWVAGRLRLSGAVVTLTAIRREAMQAIARRIPVGADGDPVAGALLRAGLPA